MDFIKFLLIFKKIIKGKDKIISEKIDELIKKYSMRCGKSVDEQEKYPMNTNEETLRKRFKSKKKIEYERNIYELNEDNLDEEFKELLENGWKNDEEFNKLKAEFNSMLKYYYEFLKEKQKSVNEEVIFE